MKLSTLFLGLAAIGTLWLTNGCSKQESAPPPPPTADNSAKTAAPVAAQKAPLTQAPQQTPTASAGNRKSADAANALAAPAAGTATTPSAIASSANLSNSAANPGVAQVKSRATNVPAVSASITNPAVATSNALATTLSSALQPQQQTLAQAGTNQWQALTAAATNRLLGALGTTNSVALTTTNQVQVLLEQAKALTTNQNYQAALGKVTELYNTKLTPEQKQQVDALKTQIQTAAAQKAAAEASSVLGGFLGGKKQ